MTRITQSACTNPRPVDCSSSATLCVSVVGSPVDSRCLCSLRRLTASQTGGSLGFFGSNEVSSLIFNTPPQRRQGIPHDSLKARPAWRSRAQALRLLGSQPDSESLIPSCTVAGSSVRGAQQVPATPSPHEEGPSVDSNHIKVNLGRVDLNHHAKCVPIPDSR